MKLLLASVALAGLAAVPLVAQDAPPPPPPGMHGPGMMMKPISRADMQAMVAQHFAMLDLNHDGKVTREEVEAARQAEMEKRMTMHRDREFAALDSNHDGSISKAEFDVPQMPGRPGGPGHDMPPPPPGGPEKGPMGGHGLMLMMGGRWFDKADANHDGAVTLAEAQKAAAETFDRIDTNHDGTISPDEMRAMFAMRGAGGHGHGGWGHHGPDGDTPPPPPPQG